MSSSFADRPPPDLERFLAALDEWRSGEITPGTTLQTLKRGGLDEVLVQNAEADSDLLAAWNAWEKGKANPGPTLEALEAAGIRGLLDRVLQTQREVFGGA